LVCYSPTGKRYGTKKQAKAAMASERERHLFLPMRFNVFKYGTSVHVGGSLAVFQPTGGDAIGTPGL
jgi:hypothetical protein